MSDESWRDCEGTWDRLSWARERRYPGATKKFVAEALSVKPGTYNAYERPPGASKWIKLDIKHGIHFAKRLRVRWEWLVLGQGEPWLPEAERPPSAKDRVKAAIEAATEEQAEGVADFLERMLKTASGR